MSMLAKRIAPQKLLFRNPFFKVRDLLLISAIFLLHASQWVGAAEKFSGIGRAATPAEIKAWDIDVRPDFLGLPSGAGSVAKGQQVWEAKCESCHGTFGESNEYFTPVAGGTTAQDMVTGRVAMLKRPDFPQRTTLMKLSQLSTLWDYINRAMPWNAPKSLSTDEVYAVTAYILNFGDIVPADFVLSDKNIREVQARLPNRNGVAKFTPLWDTNGKGDVQNKRCMSNCKTAVKIVSFLPDFAQNAHGNLAEQNRLIGPTRGIDTAKNSQGKAAIMASPVNTNSIEMIGIANKYACLACHAPNSKIIGPSYAEVAAKYKGDATAATTLAKKIKAGGSGVWGAIPMPSHPDMNDNDLQALVAWCLAGGL